MREFKVNEFISLILEDNNTIIYINGEEFIHCKGVVLDRTLDELTHTTSNLSIDQLAELAEYEPSGDSVSPETEFLVHCSNLSAWAKNDYNSELLHSNLSFPLLKKLVEAGDETAKRVFKEEMIKRLEFGYLPLIFYLSEENFDEYLTREEWYYAIFGHDQQGFKEADVILELERIMGRKLILIKDLHDNGMYEVCIENGRVHSLVIDESLKLPNSIGDLIYLHELFYTDSGIKQLPESLKNLSNLRTLDLRRNDLIILPDEIGKLSELDILNLSHNKLKVLPKCFGDFKKLTYLDLSHNELNSLPESFGDLTNLTHLDLSHNELDSLPESFNQLKSMWHLRLYYNNITDIGSKIKFFSNLESLGIAFNNIEVLGSDISTLISLESLDLSNNKITDFESLAGLIELKNLFISKNNLSYFPEVVEKLPNLRLLALDENAIKELPKSIINMGSSLTINLRGNPEFTINDLFLDELKDRNIKIIF